MRIEDEIHGRFRNEYHKGAINLTFTTNQLNYHFYNVIREHNLTPQQYNILRVLRGYSTQPSSIGFLKECMLDRHSDVSRIIEKLHERGLVDRHENAIDRRQKDVTITDAGREVLQKMDDCERKVDTLLINLTEEEVKTLNALLDKIRG